MCFSEAPRRDLFAAPIVVDSENCKIFSSTLDAMACRPSWTIRSVFKQQPSRPGLPRRLYGSAKINLNNYWNVLESLVKVEMSEPAPKKAEPQEDDDMSNEINENLSNEKLDETPAVSSEDCTNLMEVDTGLASPKICSMKLSVSPKKSSRKSSSKKMISDVENACHGAAISPAKSVTGSPKTPRAPLGIVNGNHGSGRAIKPLSPLSSIAENLARRLCKQI